MDDRDEGIMDMDKMYRDDVASLGVQGDGRDAINDRFVNGHTNLGQWVDEMDAYWTTVARGGRR